MVSDNDTGEQMRLQIFLQKLQYRSQLITPMISGFQIVLLKLCIMQQRNGLQRTHSFMPMKS